MEKKEKEKVVVKYKRRINFLEISRHIAQNNTATNSINKNEITTV